MGFCGWQVQKNGERTVQGEFEQAGAAIFKRPVKAIASGRTDSGVRAAGQVVSLKADTKMKPDEIQKALNSRLPLDIAVLDVKEVQDDFHAQYSVKEKTYRYSILNRTYRSALIKDQVYYYPYALNLTLMRKAAQSLKGTHDFKSFQAYDPLRADRDTVRTIRKITITKAGDIVHIDITANGFLYKMVRNIAGTLIAIGSKQMPANAMPAILEAKNRDEAWDTAPAQGLTLLSVKY